MKKVRPPKTVTVRLADTRHKFKKEDDDIMREKIKIFLIRCDDLDEQCAYIGKSEQLFERAKQHLKSIENRTNISSLKNAMDDDDLRIEIRLIESVEYKFDNYYKDAQRLASRENHWIDEYQEKNQCLEQVPEGKRPSIESWERQKEKYKNRSNKS